jgi:hypothetical protein
MELKSSAPRESKEVALDKAEVIGSAGVEGPRDGAEDRDDGVKNLGAGVEGPDDSVEDRDDG